MTLHVVFDIDEKEATGHVGEDDTHTLPCSYQVCDLCHGRGTHVSPSVDRDGLTSDDFAEDPDFREAYMEGAYDVQCYRCKGEKVHPEVIEERANPVSLKLLKDWQREEGENRRNYESERRMGY
jgi:hypothetical protein